MEDKLKEFALKNSKKVSVFDKYKKEILYLSQNKVSQNKILEFLKKEKKIDTSKKGFTQSNLSYYLKTLKKRQNKSSILEKPQKKEELKQKENSKKSNHKKLDFEVNKTKKITHTPNLNAAKDLY
mgnify:CR=1 FL=1